MGPSNASAAGFAAVASNRKRDLHRSPITGEVLARAMSADGYVVGILRPHGTADTTALLMQPEAGCSWNAYLRDERATHVGRCWDDDLSGQ